MSDKEMIGRVRKSTMNHLRGKYGSEVADHLEVNRKCESLEFASMLKG